MQVAIETVGWASTTRRGRCSTGPSLAEPCFELGTLSLYTHGLRNTGAGSHIAQVPLDTATSDCPTAGTEQRHAARQGIGENDAYRGTRPNVLDSNRVGNDCGHRYAICDTG